MNYIVLILGSLIVVNLFFCFIIPLYKRGWLKDINRRFFYFALSSVAWQITNAVMLLVSQESSLLFWARMTFFTAPFLIYFTFRFVAIFPRKILVHTKIIKAIEYIGLSLGLLFALSSFTPFLVKFVTYSGEFSRASYGGLFFYYTLYIVLFVACIILVAISQYRQTRNEILKSKIFFMLLGISLSAIFATLTDLVLPFLLKNDYSSNFGSFGLIFFIGFTAYAVLKRKLFDIRLIATEVLVGVIILFLLVQTIVSTKLSDILIRSFFLILVSYFGYRLISSVKGEIERRKEVEELAEKLTVVNNNLLTLQHINNKMVSTLDVKKVSQEIVESLSTELSWRGGFLALINEEKNKIYIQAISEEIKNKVIPYLDKPIDNYSLSAVGNKSLLQRSLRRLEIEFSTELSETIKGSITDETAEKIQAKLKIKTFACAPIVYRGKVIGAIVIGFDKKMAKITSEEKKMISSIADQAAIAIENAKLYEEIEKANVKLKELDKLKNEFLSIASHQVRTPLSIIKGYISLIRGKKAGEITAQQDHFMKNIQEANDQLINIINDFLNLSRIEQKRMKLEISKSDIKKIINEVMERLNHEAELKKIKLDFSSPKDDLPKINIDEPKIIEVITNLIDNAIKYSPENSKVEVRVKKKDNFLDISVKDSGIGIPEDFKDKLFQKFSRAHNAIQAQPSGNGIGLFLVKKIVDAHGGKILVKSKENKGTTFTVRLDYKSGLKPGEEIDVNKLEKEGIIRYDEYKSDKS